MQLGVEANILIFRDGHYLFCQLNTRMIYSSLQNRRNVGWRVTREVTGYVMKDFSQRILKDIAKKRVYEYSRPRSTLENPAASPPSAPNVQPATSEAKREVINYETERNPDSPQLPNICN